jgi:hypothetical protein
MGRFRAHRREICQLRADPVAFGPRHRHHEEELPALGIFSLTVQAGNALSSCLIA